MYTITAVVLIILSIAMVGLILLQPGQGDLSSTFGGLSSQFGSMFGMRKTEHLLAKLTRYLAIAIMLLCLVANRYFLTGGPKVEQVKPITEGAKPPITQSAPPVQAPGK